MRTNESLADRVLGVILTKPAAIPYAPTRQRGCDLTPCTVLFTILYLPRGEQRHSPAAGILQANQR